MRYFVFVEFLHHEVRDFFMSLRGAFMGAPSGSPVHVTLRGPYTDKPDPDELEKFAVRLRGHGVRIARCGHFATTDGFAVFLHAECSVFHEMWDKPDFKPYQAQIQPHITLFESANREAARRVLDFLRKENPQVHTYDIALSVYASKQQELFGSPVLENPQGMRRMHRDIWMVSDGMLDRARTLGDDLAHGAGDA